MGFVLEETTHIAHRVNPLIGLLLLYGAASLLHFAHNAEYLSDYPNLPPWLTRPGVYLAWCVQAAVGILGYLLYRSGRRLIGLVLIGAYAGFGFDGLLHYTRAPLEAHTAAMNFTIGFEVVTAALLLVCVLAAARRQFMSTIQPCELPTVALLGRYLGGGAYADCYVTEIGRRVTHAEYVAAFYTTWVFKLERLLLQWLVSRPSTDAQAQELGSGTRDTFAAWDVEGRATDQLLLTDFRGRTRSWLMVAGAEINSRPGTRLYFGSAVVPHIDRKSGPPTLGFTYRALLGFHKLYSRVLLRAARRQLMRVSAG
jgi:hypothetical protein